MKTKLFQILGVAAIATMGMASCDTDPCQDVECGDNGTCLEGDCVCDPFYMSSANGKCDVTYSAQYANSDVEFEETCVGVNNGTFLYTSNIEANGAGGIRFTNLGGYETNIDANITAGNDKTFTIDEDDSAGRSWNGTGTLTSTTITVEYIVTFADNTADTCTAVGTLP